MARLSLFYRRLATEGPRGIGEHLLWWGLIPLGRLYGVAGRLRVAMYRRGLIGSYRAPVPVVSVGNLSVGGTGKTPMVDYLVKYYEGRGKRVAVVSRGYGGTQGRGVAVVCCGEGPLLSPRQCGDEPYLLARRNPLALVLTAPRRAQGVRMAWERFGAEVVVLDDGFQHLAVKRDLDIVLLDARCPLGNGEVFPAGLLREFPSALERADLHVLTRCSSERRTEDMAEGASVGCRFVLSDEGQSLRGETVSLVNLAGLRGVAFAGIADPEGFFAGVKAKGVSLGEAVALPDHVAYDAPVLSRLAAACRGADFLVTTEKDGVKLKAEDFQLPCYQVPLELDFFEPGPLEQALAMVIRQGDDMALSQELLEILACPKCKGQVHLKEDGAAIVCESCRLIYPVRDDIPVMLIDEAESF